MSNRINWYPGHMFKAKKEIISQLKIIDLVIEVIDARVPISSHNEMLDELTQNKEKLLIFTKADLVNENYLKKFLAGYEQKGYNTISISTNNSVDRKKLFKKINDVAKVVIDKYAKKGINKTVRVLIMGMPNVGKSSAINFLVNKKKTTTGNKPGVTKQQQWIKLENNIELLDTPGILIPKIEDENRAYKLVCCSLIKEEVVELEHVCVWLVNYLINHHKQSLMARYRLRDADVEDIPTAFDAIAKSIGAVIKNDDYDYDRVSKTVINDFRKQKFGLIILDE